jgi:hypothetical protein
MKWPGGPFVVVAAFALRLGPVPLRKRISQPLQLALVLLEKTVSEYWIFIDLPPPLLNRLLETRVKTRIYEAFDSPNGGELIAENQSQKRILNTVLEQGVD